MKWIFCSCILLTLGVSLGSSYNLEGKLPLFKYGPKGSKFGYSVALHRIGEDYNDNLAHTLMVAGAPQAEYPLNDFLNPLEKPVFPGGVFSCPVTTLHKDCLRIVIDKGGNRHDVSKNILHSKDNQWLGVTVKSQGAGRYLVTCAHRSRQEISAGDPDNESERLCGRCFILKARNHSLVEIPPDSDELPRGFVSSPCDLYSTGRSDHEHKNRYAYTLAGTAVGFTADNTYVMGTPGAWAWTGGLFDFPMPDGDNDRVNRYQTPTCLPHERVYSEFRIWHCGRIPTPRDAYVGFSLSTSTSIDTDDDTQYYAAGAPRGNQTGAVLFFKRGAPGRSQLVPDIAKTVYGDAIHASFGYSVALTDLNGDGLDDLIVGAPQFYERSSVRKAGGAVYVYMNEDKKDFGSVEPEIIYGQEDSYFGYSVAAIGDIDQDGYNDFAVGAPYEESGVVYVYRGGLDGPRKAQELRGSDYAFVADEFQELTGFGASLSGDVDTDGNKYPDLLIGSFSDSIALLRSRPVISVRGEFDVATKELDLDVKSCRLELPRTCFEITYCLSYTERHAHYAEGVTIKYKVTLDSGYKGPVRLYATTPLNGTVTLPKAGDRLCPGDRQMVYFNDKYLVDKLTDIRLTFEFDVDSPEVERENKGDPVFSIVKDPILDKDLHIVSEKDIKIKNTCGDDGCQSNLVVNATMDSEIIVGEDQTANLTLYIENLGEEAHQADLEIQLPPKLRFDDYAIVNASLPEMRCNTVSISLIKCILGDPYMPGMKDEIIIRLSTEDISADTQSVDVVVVGHTISENPKILPISLHASVLVMVDLSFRGFGEPEQVRYELRSIVGESAVENPSEIGSQLLYNFEVSNEGLFPVDGITVDVHLPIEIFNGKWLLYPFDASVTTGSGILAGTCNTTNINILQIENEVPASAIYAPSRKKRNAGVDQEAPQAEALTAAAGYNSRMLTCENSRCVNIACSLDRLDAGTTTSVSLMIRTTVDHGELSQEADKHFPWWFILIGVLIILLIYVTILILFVRCGFFKRKKYLKKRDSVTSDEKMVLEEEKDEARL